MGLVVLSSEEFAWLRRQIDEQHALIRELEERKDKPPPHHHGSLSPQELRVLVYIAQGYSYTQMAVIMGLSERTIRTHGFRVLKKLGVHSVLQAALYAWREGIISVEEAWTTVQALQWRTIRKGR